MKGSFKYGCPIVKIEIQNDREEVLLDSGFNGQLMLPIKLIKKLKLKHVGYSDYLSADGEEIVTKLYDVAVKLFDESMKVEALSTDSDLSLAGMELLHNYKIVIERSKDEVEITKSR
ncbi:MAG: hypothetical protein CMH64_01030 [Nanoarchaeota archaeon]|nr:hypothetical protein [Nanoarchaeota archaeon]|tara:strand:- start:1642 stop:1992 length:351 start_codon:yes stop_codon:yes gene_type:complete